MKVLSLAVLLLPSNPRREVNVDMVDPDPRQHLQALRPSETHLRLPGDVYVLLANICHGVDASCTPARPVACSSGSGNVESSTAHRRRAAVRAGLHSRMCAGHGDTTVTSATGQVNSPARY